MPSRELFINMKEEYQKEILPDGVRKVFIEASNGDIFSEFVYSRKYLITLNEFGKSGQSNDVLTHFAFDEKSLKERLLKLFL